MKQVVYEVNIALAPTIEQNYVAWLRTHIQQILALPGFVSADLFQVEGGDPKTKNWSVQYTLESLEHLQYYFIHYAPALRQEAVDKFGVQFSAARRVLLVSEKFRRP